MNAEDAICEQLERTKFSGIHPPGEQRCNPNIRRLSAVLKGLLDIDQVWWRTQSEVPRHAGTELEQMNGHKIQKAQTKE